MVHVVLPVFETKKVSVFWNASNVWKIWRIKNIEKGTRTDQQQEKLQQAMAAQSQAPSNVASDIAVNPNVHFCTLPHTFTGTGPILQGAERLKGAEHPQLLLTLKGICDRA